MFTVFCPRTDTGTVIDTGKSGSVTQKLAEFEAAGAVVIGMSPDPVKKHDKFIDIKRGDYSE